MLKALASKDASSADFPSEDGTLAKLHLTLEPKGQVARVTIGSGTTSVGATHLRYLPGEWWDCHRRSEDHVYAHAVPAGAVAV